MDKKTQILSKNLVFVETFKFKRWGFYLRQFLVSVILLFLVSVSNADSIIFIPSFVDADLVIAMV